MPTYEYLCKSCGHRFEAWQHFTDDPLTECPNCGSRIQRVLYPAGIVFKGSGFYKNDSRAASASAVTSDGDGSAGKSESSGESSVAAKASEPASAGTAASSAASAKAAS